MSGPRQQIEIETSQGAAHATPEDDYSGEKWQLTHPWGETPFFGTAAQAKAKLKRLVALNEDDEDHE